MYERATSHPHRGSVHSIRQHAQISKNVSAWLVAVLLQILSYGVWVLRLARRCMAMSSPINLTATGFETLGSQASYLDVYDGLGKQNVSLNVLERLWAAWYLWMQNDILATGIMSFLMHELVYFGRCLPWMIIDRIPYFNKWKLQKTKIPTLKEQWDCASLVLLSHFTVELPQIWLFHPIATYCGMDYGVPFPPLTKMALHVAIFFVMEDTWHYCFHRALHYGPLYRAIHKLHHTYSAPFGLAAEYASPIEVMLLALGTIGPPIAWAAITHDLHLVTMYVWIVCRLFQAIDAHSGYDFPWSLHHFLPFWAGAHHHDIHHEKFIGNYSSSFRWWDYLLDTEAGAEAARKRREKKLQSIKAGKANKAL